MTHYAQETISQRLEVVPPVTEMAKRHVPFISARDY